MSRLIIRNVGPIKSVDIRLNKVNVFIGPQGSGKSTIAKIVSFCSWLEKVNEATDRAAVDGLIKRLGKFHHMEEYFTEKSVILYLGDNVVEVVNMFFSNVVLVLWNSGVQILLFMSGIQSIPLSLYESASVDGATEWEKFWKITLPMLVPIILLNLV